MADINPQVVKRIREIPRFPIYRNTQRIMAIRGADIMMEDLMLASALSKSNVMLVGDRGCGKTLLAEELMNTYFGGEGIYARLTASSAPPSEIFTHIDLRKLYDKSARSDDELRVLSDNINSHVIIVDEFNRAPDMVQNYIFPLADGKIVLETGQQVRIGDGYSIVVLTGNIGDGRFGGTFKIDSALLDRCHLSINFDNYPTTVADDIAILGADHDPRLRQKISLQPGIAYVHSETKETLTYEGEGDNGKERFITKDGKERVELGPEDLAKLRFADVSHAIIEMHELLAVQEHSIDLEFTLHYLRRSLDWCEKEGAPKSHFSMDLPNMCEGCAELGWGCGFVRGITTRIEKSTLGLTMALQHVAEAKLQAAGLTPTDNDLSDVLEVYRVIAPQEGLVDRSYIERNAESRKKYHGSPQLFFDEFVTWIKDTDFESHKDAITAIIGEVYLIIDGKARGFSAKTVNDLGGRWSVFVEIAKALIDEHQSGGRK